MNQKNLVLSIERLLENARKLSHEFKLLEDELIEQKQRQERLQSEFKSLKSSNPDPVPKEKEKEKIKSSKPDPVPKKRQKIIIVLDITFAQSEIHELFDKIDSSSFDILYLDIDPSKPLDEQFPGVDRKECVYLHIFFSGTSRYADVLTGSFSNPAGSHKFGNEYAHIGEFLDSFQNYSCVFLNYYSETNPPLYQSFDTEYRDLKLKMDSFPFLRKSGRNIFYEPFIKAFFFKLEKEISK